MRYIIILIGLLFIIGCGGETMSNVAVFETTKGNFEIQLYPDNAPITVDNFVQYVNDGFYDGTVFHRVIKGFMVQGGGFTPDKNQKETRDPIKLESQNGLKNDIGTVAMARTMEPDSATAQFFVNTKDNDFLNYGSRDEGYAVFGKVITGMNVIKDIEGVPTGPGDWPKEDIIINKAYMK